MKRIQFYSILSVLLLAGLHSNLHAGALSVLYFDNNTGKPDYQWMSKGIADMLMGDLSRLPALHVVEREDLNKILKEQSLSASGVTEGKGIQIGKLLDADKILMGSYILSGNRLRIDVRISDTESGKVLHSMAVEGNKDTLLHLEKELAGKVMDALGQPRPEGLDRTETESIEAATVYYQGLDLLDSGKAKEALAKFQQASDIDPTYAKPIHGIEESYRFLKDFRKQRQQREILALYEKMEAFQRRLRAKSWITYSQWIMKNSNLDPQARTRYQNSPDGQALMLCDVPARCVWHLMMTRVEAGDKLEEYFAVSRKREALYRENLQDAARASKAFAEDPVLSEVLYMELFSLHALGEKKALQTKAREFMTRYPDYRLIEFVEEWYEESLKEG